jgi:hypothetical protein
MGSIEPHFLDSDSIEVWSSKLRKLSLIDLQHNCNVLQNAIDSNRSTVKSQEESQHRTKDLTARLEMCKRELQLRHKNIPVLVVHEGHQLSGIENPREVGRVACPVCQHRFVLYVDSNYYTLLIDEEHLSDWPAQAVDCAKKELCGSHSSMTGRHAPSVQVHVPAIRQ